MSLASPVYRCPACGVASVDPEDARNYYCANCKAFEADDPKLVQVLIDKALASHKSNPALPRREVLRALRLLQEVYHLRELDKTTYRNRESGELWASPSTTPLYKPPDTY